MVKEDGQKNTYITWITAKKDNLCVKEDNQNKNYAGAYGWHVM